MSAPRGQRQPKACFLRTVRPTGFDCRATRSVALSLVTREFEMPAEKKSTKEAQLRSGAIAKSMDLLPGILLSILISLVAYGIQFAQEHYFDHPYLEALVIAIVLGAAVRTAWVPGPRWQAGIAFCAKQILEVAVTLLGASISFSLLAASGFALLSALVATVAVMLAVTYGLSRLLRLPVRLSILVACGN